VLELVLLMLLMLLMLVVLVALVALVVLAVLAVLVLLAASAELGTVLSTMAAIDASCDARECCAPGAGLTRKFRSRGNSDHEEVRLISLDQPLLHY
jgi:hypothetical protein